LDTLGDLLNRRGRNINDFNLPRKSAIGTVDSSNRLFDEELSYNAKYLMSESEKMILQLNNGQHCAFDCIVHADLSNNPGFFFVSGYGGTEKTYLWNTIISYLRAQKNCSISSIVWSCVFTSTRWSDSALPF
jgi:hypothetical protein